MKFQTISTNAADGLYAITLNRNSINALLLKEINLALDEAERDSTCPMVILEGQSGFFCTGMDFEEAAAFEDGSGDNPLSVLYMETIKRFASTSKIIIAKVDGIVMAGGVGLAAASDLCIATPRSQFSLSEALWGLLPAMVIPYLIRRVGYQTAYKMTLTTIPLSAEEAFGVHLVDEVSDSPDQVIRQYRRRLERLQPSTISNMKRYFRQMWMINDEMERVAVSEISRLVSSYEVKENIKNFLFYKKFPWEK